MPKFTRQTSPDMKICILRFRRSGSTSDRCTSCSHRRPTSPCEVMVSENLCRPGSVPLHAHLSQERRETRDMYGSLIPDSDTLQASQETSRLVIWHVPTCSCPSVEDTLIFRGKDRPPPSTPPCPSPDLRKLRDPRSTRKGKLYLRFLQPAATSLGNKFPAPGEKGFLRGGGGCMRLRP
jgi:hypothetical protein